MHNNSAPAREYTLQDIFLRFGGDFRKAHSLPYETHKAMNAIERCHTLQMGCHLVQCQTCGCGYQKTVYNSCRDRHCPACQSYQSAKWVQDREVELLPVPYFHAVFTIPWELNPIALLNKAAVYDILFQAAWESLDTLMKDQKRFGGQGAAIAVLHTWGQNLMDHPHVHMIVPGGALLKGRGEWRQKNGGGVKDFLVPIGPLRILFRNKFLGKLARIYKARKLVLSGPVQYLENPPDFYALKETAYRKNWVVYVKEPFAGPKQVLAYLGRYTHRVAISNSRIRQVENGQVTFSLKNYRRGGRKEIMTLPAPEFIRRFILHIVPHGFRRIRMFGFLANRFKFKNLEKIREGLRISPAKIVKVKKTAQELILKFFGVNILACPVCGKNSLGFFPSPALRFGGG